MSTLRALAGATFVVVLAGMPCFAQPAAAPALTRAERAALQALVAAADRGAPLLDIPEADWPLHLLRASDGSHYVAFSLHAGADITTTRPVVLYVRLATRRAARSNAPPERSGVASWLAGQSPAPVLARRGIAIGDMPTFGPGGIAVRGPGPSQGLQLLELERERARQRREAQEQERKAALEGAETTRHPRPLLPFEDFDLGAVAEFDASGTPVLRRSLAAGPGDYELTVAWVDPTAPDPSTAARVARRTLVLAPASSTALTLSTVIVADHVSVREKPVAAVDQTAHPYSIGATEIVPARDHTLTTDERLALVVQVINARGSAAGKPDIVIGFRVLRRDGAAEALLGTLAPQVYNDQTLPADFDTARGHPIFAAVAVPLQTFKRGKYRIEIAAEDRLAGAVARADTTFTVIATPAALLRDAPALVRPFQREDLLELPIINEITTRLRPPTPSAAMLAALAVARERRFVELVREDGGAPDEAGARTALRTLALYALGDSPGTLVAPLRLAQEQAAHPAGAGILAGGLRALEGNDREALAAWDAALDAGGSRPILAPLMMNAWLRLGEPGRAVALGRAALTPGADPALARRLAAALVADRRHAEAVKTLDRHLALDPADSDAQWLLLHALFAEFATAAPAAADTAAQTRFGEIAARYIAANGRHAALAREWALAMGAALPAPPPAR